MSTTRKVDQVKLPSIEVRRLFKRASVDALVEAGTLTVAEADALMDDGLTFIRYASEVNGDITVTFNPVWPAA